MIEKLGITPGPWNMTQDENDPDICIYTNAGDWIANVGGEFPINRTDARLIAAAPEMLEALIDATIEILNNDLNEFEMKHINGGIKMAEDNNRIQIDAIEKATGKTVEEIKKQLDET